ncbi:MAG: hypothetical protein HRT74_00775, partial [Flavobacteriales bacterium]|nr:hypothetical protein [Flavobacteriales bacterium]
GVDLLTEFPIPTFLLWTILGYALLNLLLFQFLEKGNKLSPARFVTAFQGAVGLKLLFSIGVVALGLYLVEDHRKTIAIGVMLIYAFFTVTLIRYWFRALKK